MKPNRSNRPRDCQVPDCPFNPYVDAVCSNCGREKPKSNVMIWVALAIGTCIGVPLSLFGGCIVALSSGPNTKQDPTALSILAFGLLLVGGMIALAIFTFVKNRRK